MAYDQIVFNWEYEEIPGYGRIFRPYVPVQLKTKEASWKSFDFIVDTGADVTMLPYYMLTLLDIDKNKLEEYEFVGIGGNSVTSWKTTITIKIGTWQLNVRAAFASDNLTPLLLGRADTLDSNFSWLFDVQQKKIIFRK